MSETRVSRNPSRRWRAVALVLLATLVAPGAWALEPGDPAPGFSLLDANEMEHALEAYRGNVVLLAFVGYS